MTEPNLNPVSDMHRAQVAAFAAAFAVAPDADRIAQRLQRIARKADVMRLDAKARGNRTLAADAAEILALADDAAAILRGAK